MIKIGRCYFNTSEIAAIEPDRDGDSADVFLARGSVIHVDIHEGDLQALLERTGVLRPVGEPVTVLEFSGAERETLRRAYEDGYLFAAMDLSGQVFAYTNRPEKQTRTWIDHDEGEPPRRLHGEFECLSFEDDEPLSLEALFCG